MTPNQIQWCTSRKISVLNSTTVKRIKQSVTAGDARFCVAIAQYRPLHLTTVTALNLSIPGVIDVTLVFVSPASPPEPIAITDEMHQSGSFTFGDEDDDLDSVYSSPRSLVVQVRKSTRIICSCQQSDGCMLGTPVYF